MINNTNIIHDKYNRTHQLSDDKILLNNVLFPNSIDIDAGYMPHDIRAWVIGNEYGTLCMVWASHEQEAFDEACDAGLIDCLMAENQDYENEELAPCGNAGELFDLSYAWIHEVQWDATRDIQLIVRIIRAVENQQTTLER